VSGVRQMAAGCMIVHGFLSDSVGFCRNSSDACPAVTFFAAAIDKRRNLWYNSSVGGMSAVRCVPFPVGGVVRKPIVFSYFLFFSFLFLLNCGHGGQATVRCAFFIEKNPTFFQITLAFFRKL